jgi:hypothetical protein
MPKEPPRDIISGSGSGKNMVAPAAERLVPQKSEVSDSALSGPTIQPEKNPQVRKNESQTNEQSVASNVDLVDYLAAADLVVAGRYEEAYWRFREIGERSPPTAFRVRALVRSGEIASQYLRDPSRAREVLKRCLQPEYAALIDQGLRESIQKAFQELE